MRMMRIRQANAITSLWAFAEATVFIIVPDVLLSWLALRSFKRGLIACLFALLGSLIGGATMWLWAKNNPDSARAIVESLPAISRAMIVSVQQQIAESGLTALFLGPLGGIPYKIYAVEAADLSYGLAIFLGISIPARLSRFALVTIVAGAASLALRRRFSLRTVQMIHVSCWVAFYTWFFWAIANS